MVARSMLVLVGLLALATHAHAATGWGTAYSGDGDKDATGRNACNYGNLGPYFENYYAALPLNSWNHGYCGRCLRARGTERGASGDWVLVKVIDQCAGCRGGDVDFSSRALKDITGFSWDKKKIEWEWADCDSAPRGRSARKSPSKKHRRYRRHRHHRHG